MEAWGQGTLDRYGWTEVRRKDGKFDARAGRAPDNGKTAAPLAAAVCVPAQPPTYATPADAELANVGLARISNAGAGNCGGLSFAACAQQIGEGELATLTHVEVRAAVVAELRKNPDMALWGW